MSVTNRLFRNILFTFLAFLLVAACYKKVPGYTWVYDSLLQGNLKVIKQYRHTTMDQRYELKLGFTYAYLRYLRENTPDTAVIYIPIQGFKAKPKGQPEFTGTPWNKLWAARFLHPRKIVYDNDPGCQYIDRITHVAIANGYGYEQLPYQVANPVNNTVLPIKIDSK